MQKNIYEIITTMCYVGKIKLFPGTFGSLLSYPLYYIIVYLTINNQPIFILSDNNIFDLLLNIFIISMFVSIVLFILGLYTTSQYIKYTQKEDPREVIIDEVVGQLLVITMCMFSLPIVYSSQIALYINSSYIVEFIFMFLLPFVLFRFFDIRKPWPINWCDKNIKGGFGVMLDDIVAAIFASIIHYVIIFLIIDWFPYD